MKPPGQVLIALMAAIMLGGCVAGQSLPTKFEAASGESRIESSIPIAVSVTDQRPYVVSGAKPPYYIGKYRAGFGNPWDVSTENDESLAALITRDLSSDLAAIGHPVAAGAEADRQLTVSIKEWNFDGYQNGRFWYALLVTVSDANGGPLAESTVQEQIHIKGTLMMGAKGGFEREMPKLYPQIIRKIARDNAAISAALSGRPAK